ncbi:class I SAM-dependent methyltransferase [Algoriphagus halophilus]|uniref:Ubiquinone/menaquinone biosynthesis C-methylase UbiE n=1 Tax=Algoriphagus halophilus TaxID=226505 RepID=A0A1N6HSJ1_9BACT|nr:class I SAM-dependent methyltransferase [Algoriphagus halophilus]SIO22629.1 Ubiquinone/menaquinone biosynthesis C-methylase UbiE [Algoriphagus halophilus]
MKDSYGFIAPYYNRLAKLVFGNQLALAKQSFISDLRKKKVLIIGGGDGKDYQIYQEGLQGDYWELSQAMLELAKKNLPKSSLNFQWGYFRQVEDQTYDEIWLHFVLDTMLDSEIVELLDQLKKSLVPSGSIFLVDFFQPTTLKSKVLQFLMISFFRIAAQHKRKNTPDYEELFKRCLWEKEEEHIFLKCWIKAQLWKKSDG